MYIYIYIYIQEYIANMQNIFLYKYPNKGSSNQKCKGGDSGRGPRAFRRLVAPRRAQRLKTKRPARNKVREGKGGRGNQGGRAQGEKVGRVGTARQARAKNGKSWAGGQYARRTFG